MLGHFANEFGNLIPLILTTGVVQGSNIATPLIRISSLTEACVNRIEGVEYFFCEVKGGNT